MSSTLGYSPRSNYRHLIHYASSDITPARTHTHTHTHTRYCSAVWFSPIHLHFSTIRTASYFLKMWWFHTSGKLRWINCYYIHRYFHVSRFLHHVIMFTLLAIFIHCVSRDEKWRRRHSTNLSCYLPAQILCHYAFSLLSSRYMLVYALAALLVSQPKVITM